MSLGHWKGRVMCRNTSPTSVPFGGGGVLLLVDRCTLIDKGCFTPGSFIFRQRVLYVHVLSPPQQSDDEGGDALLGLLVNAC
jgi:hypothetical protein